jgi:4-amino-4-deoxy-L-arabinose transferase-like glycosyltransferase
MTDKRIDVGPVEQAHVRRAWCVRLAVGLVLLGAVLNIIYLWWHCPLDLGEDEAHYWEWSRHLDWGDYSKGPGVAWIIAAATAVGRWFGIAHATMPVVRMPAVLFGVISGLTSLSLARRIFRDDRVALAVTLLCAGVPVFAVGSLLITIDSPMYCCWALAVWAIWRAVEASASFEPAPSGPEGRSPVAPGGSPGYARIENCGVPKGQHFLYLAGFFTGLGMLAKPVLIAVPLCALVAAWMSPAIRRRLATWHSAAAVLLALAMQAPVVIWNSQHGWMMFRHIGTQGGMGAGHDASPIPMLLRPFARLAMYIGIQAGVLAGILFVLLILAVIWALRERCHASDGVGAPSEASESRVGDPSHASPPKCAVEAWHPNVGLTFLLAFTAPLWLFYAALSLWTNVEPNWPVASYFTGMILLAGFVVRFWNQRVDLRRWVTGAIAGGVILTFAGQHLDRLYPYIARGTFAHYEKTLRRMPTFRLQGYEARALALDAVLKQMQQQTGHKPMVITDRYDYSSSLAFYLPGQPFVYSIMSSVGGRMNQYDVWPGVNERDGSGALVHRGENAVVVGASLDDKTINAVIVPAFKRVDPVEHVPVYDEHGLQIRQLTIWRCYDFQGLPEAKGARSY